MKKVDVIIPTYKPGMEFLDLIEKLEMQTIKPNKIILMNTEQKFIIPFLEKTKILEKHSNIEIHHVSQTEFDHGNTRHCGVQFSEAEFFLCMTQDAVPADKKMIEELIQALQQNHVAVAYGRQLAREDSHILEEYSRNFNYPDKSILKGKEHIKELGIKTYFCSNVCAMYNRKIYNELGGFIRRTIFNEDMIYAAGAIKAGYKIAYVAKAQVIHSHYYTGKQQFYRNFDLGVSQADHPEVFKDVPSEKEGGKLVKGTLQFLWKQGKFYYAIPFVYQCGCKYLGYRLGKAYKKLPKKLILSCTMNRNYWRF